MNLRTISFVLLNLAVIRAAEDKSDSDSLSAYRDRYFVNRPQALIAEESTKSEETLKTSATNNSPQPSQQPPVKDDKPPRFSIGLGVLAPSYSQKFGTDGKTKLDFNSEKDGAFSYSLTNFNHPQQPQSAAQVKDDKRDDKPSDTGFPNFLANHNMAGYNYQQPNGGQPVVNIFHRQGWGAFPGLPAWQPSLVGSTSNTASNTATTTTTTPAPPTYPPVFTAAHLYNPFMQYQQQQLQQQQQQQPSVQQSQPQTATLPYFNPFLQAYPQFQQPQASTPVKTEEKKPEPKPDYGRAPIDLYSLMAFNKGRAFPFTPAELPGSQLAQAQQQQLPVNMQYNPVNAYNPAGNAYNPGGLATAASGYNPYTSMSPYGGYGAASNLYASQSLAPFLGGGVGFGGGYPTSLAAMGYPAPAGGLQTAASNQMPYGYGQALGGGAGYGGMPGGYGAGVGGAGGRYPLGATTILGQATQNIATWLNPFRVGGIFGW